MVDGFTAVCVRTNQTDGMSGGIDEITAAKQGKRIITPAWYKAQVFTSLEVVSR